MTRTQSRTGPPRRAVRGWIGDGNERRTDRRERRSTRARVEPTGVTERDGATAGGAGR